MPLHTPLQCLCTPSCSASAHPPAVPLRTPLQCLCLCLCLWLSPSSSQRVRRPALITECLQAAGLHQGARVLLACTAPPSYYALGLTPRETGWWQLMQGGWTVVLPPPTDAAGMQCTGAQPALWCKPCGSAVAAGGTGRERHCRGPESPSRCQLLRC